VLFISRASLLIVLHPDIHLLHTAHPYKRVYMKHRHDPRYMIFLETWRSAKDFIAQHDNQLLIREVSATLAGLVIVALTATVVWVGDMHGIIQAEANQGLLYSRQATNPGGLKCGVGAESGGPHGISVGWPFFTFLCMAVPNAMIYSLVSKVAALNDETSRQIQILEQFQSQGRATGSDELYTAVGVTKRGRSSALKRGDAVPSLFGIALNVRASLFARLFLVCMYVVLLCVAGVSTYVFLTKRLD
jgi:hypothetical protein